MRGLRLVWILVCALGATRGEALAGPPGSGVDKRAARPAETRPDSQVRRPMAVFVIGRQTTPFAPPRGDDTAARDEAVARLERFIAEHPDHPGLTPDAMLRLAELYADRAQGRFADALDHYVLDLERHQSGEQPGELAEPRLDVGDATRLLEDLTKRFAPRYAHSDAALYLLAYLRHETADDKGALAAWTALVEGYPKSAFVPEVWLRIGELHFDDGDLPLARRAYERAAASPEARWYALALYKLAWTHYREVNYPAAIATFGRLLDWCAGPAPKDAEPALRDEAVQYIALMLTEDDWDDDGHPDPGAGLARIRSHMKTARPWSADVLAEAARVFDSVGRAADATAVRALLPRDPPGPAAPK